MTIPNGLPLSPEPEKELAARQRLPIRIMSEHPASLALVPAPGEGEVCSAGNT